MAIATRTPNGNVTYDLTGASPLSQTVTIPTGVVTGDLMIMSVQVGAYSGAVSCNTPTGWTSVGTVQSSSNGVWAFWRTAQAGDSTWTITGTVTGTAYIGIELQAFSGCNNSQPDATGTTSTSTSSPITANSVTVVAANSWEVLALVTDGTGTFTATGFTATSNAGTNEQGSILYNTTPKGTGATGTVSVTISGGVTIIACVPFTIAPAVAGGSYISPPFPSIPGALLTM